MSGETGGVYSHASGTVFFSLVWSGVSGVYSHASGIGSF